MARLTFVYRTEIEEFVCINRRQLPVVAGETLSMIMDLNSRGLCIDSPQIRGREFEEFSRKFNVLSSEELKNCLEIDNATFMSVLNQCVQCIGCRRRVEKLLTQLRTTGHPTLDPLVFKNSSEKYWNTITITAEKMKSPRILGTLLYRHHEILNDLLESKLRNKTRCAIHSLDTFRSKPFSENWRDIWDSMKHDCREALFEIDTSELHEVLEEYLKKHKFCQGCRTKIEKAYKILIGEITTKEKGFVSLLYANIKKCQPEKKHIHVITTKTDFLDALIKRAEPEVNGSFIKQRERHAKTLEVAQEEVLTCVGMILYKRLRMVHANLREEERACQVLAAISIHALSRSFDMKVENIQGCSNLEFLYQWITRSEKAKEHKRELKKLRKKKKKIEKRNIYNMYEKVDTGSDTAEADEDEEKLEEMDIVVDGDVSDTETEKSTKTDETDYEKLNICTEVESSSTKQLVNGQKNKKPQKEKTKQLASQKKNKKRKNQQRTENESPRRSSSCSVDTSENCNGCLTLPSACGCENDIKDLGYGSESTTQGNSRISSADSSPDCSVVSCSDGLCNHQHDSEDDHTHPTQYESDLYNCKLKTEKTLQLSLLQMLDNNSFSNRDGCYIPQDVIFNFQSKREEVQKKRLQLRETLRANFARLCSQKRSQFICK